MSTEYRVGFASKEDIIEKSTYGKCEERTKSLSFSSDVNSITYDEASSSSEEYQEYSLLRTQSSLAPPIEASAIVDVEEAWKALSKELEESHSKPTIRTLGTVFVTREEVGTKDSIEYRLFYKNEDGYKISPWHDVPLWFSETPLLYNMIIEIPKLTNKKFEINTKEEYTPLYQDRKLERLRTYPGPIPWNYGAFPQTWEDPNKKGDENVDFSHGDNDPLDAVEIGVGPLPRGTIIQVKILGCLALIDDDELDWKVVCIRVCDPHASQLNNITDVEKYFPGTIDRIRRWFGLYKAIENKDVAKVNMYGHFGEPQSAEFAHSVILETHHSYLRLIRGEAINSSSLWIPKSLSNNGETELCHTVCSTNSTATVSSNDIGGLSVSDD
ncbi:Inorganic pyrophosphatase [Cryptosporidium tyzzeri]|nr:Inorganic pyrophosphatase [Cryptosporidium tyzzeri]